MPLERHFKMTELLPHEGRMLLLDEVVDADADKVICALTIRADSMFCDGGKGVPSWVGLEYMAQTASSYSGLEEARAGTPATIGLLLGTRRYTVDMPYFPIGACLLVEAHVVLRDDNDLVAFDCTISEAERVIARADVKAYRPKDVFSVVRGERI
jgi:predicted hotdog family 3-hydroxylacyl-ACP dehydratase